jgi:manganese/zinc/iron transport system substrate-binding protein
MLRNFLVLFYLSTLLFLVSCSDVHSNRNSQFQKWIQQNGKIKILSTTAMINDIVKQVGGEHIDSLTLIEGELDPHSYQVVKGDDEKLAFAHLIFSNGLGLEHGPSLQRYLKENSKNVSLGDRLAQKEPALIIDVKGQKDPHIWMDISLWAKIIPFISEVLSQQDPTHAADFQANAAKLEKEMAVVHQQVKQIMHEIPENQRYLVTSHDAFNYFTRTYLSNDGEVETGEWQKRFAAPEGLAPESQLSTTDIKSIIDHMRRYHIHVLFPESNVSQDSIRKIVQAGKEKGLELKIAYCCPLYADAMGAPGSEGDTYLKMVAYDAKIIADHLKDNKE